MNCFLAKIGSRKLGYLPILVIPFSESLLNEAVIHFIIV